MHYNLIVTHYSAFHNRYKILIMSLCCIHRNEQCANVYNITCLCFCSMISVNVNKNIRIKCDLFSLLYGKCVFKKLLNFVNLNYLKIVIRLSKIYHFYKFIE